VKRLSIALGLILLAAVSRAAEPANYSLEVNFKATGQTGEYLCEATITNLDTGAVFSAPQIRTLVDVPATVKTSDGDLAAELVVAVNSKTSTASAALKMSRAGKIVASQKTSIRIQ
jgi:hypothetical protein